MSPLKILILGGTTEASALAAQIVGDDRYSAMLSLAGATQSPKPSQLATRVGGFGGRAGLCEYLVREQIDALVDATHPFAALISANAVAAAEEAGVPHIAILRPPWADATGDDWRRVPDMPAAAAALGGDSNRVFLTIGRKDLAPFQAHPQHRYIIRSVDPPPADLLPPNATVISARGPFALDDELALLRDQQIDCLVTKNSGGTAPAAKLEAARALNLPVIMVSRPPPPENTVETPEAVLLWLAAQHQERSPARRGV
jgi:precorrin-6A/cobalt-precorrin-6A reductase